MKGLVVSTKSSAGSSIEAAVTPNSSSGPLSHHHHHPSNGTSVVVRKQKFCCSKPEEYEFIPKYAIERFILSGYRLNLSLKECFLSLFTLHNETINIWTALVSFVFFLVVLVRVLLYWNLESGYHTTAYVIYAASAVYTFGASLSYHWFNCMSSVHHTCLLRMDISGIGFLILGSFYPPVYYSFYCHPNWGIFYLTLETVLCICCSVMMLVPRFATDDYRRFRVSLFFGISAVSIFPLLHLFYIYGFSNALLLEKMTGVVHTYLLYILAIIFYATKIPERFAPGRFDYLFHSHQFWHTFIFLATFAHFYNMLTVMSRFYTEPCFGLKSYFH
jgi:adiponectin receptor